MILQLPMPYEDELLYSLLARTALRSGNVSHRAILLDLFGTDNFTASVELQPGISNIISNMPVGSKISADQLISQNTMYPFFTAFRDEEQSLSIYSSLFDEHGRDLHNAIGLMSSGVKPVTHFQFCIFCNQEHVEEHGELYWRRLFQIPGVRICVKHGIWLSESTVLTRGRTQHVFTAPTQDNCSNQRVQMVSDNIMFGQYSCIINNIERLLNCKYPNRPMEWFYYCYKTRLMRKGYASDKGRVDYKQLRKDFIEYYGVELLDILQSSICGESSWLKLIFQKHRKGFHPIRHLLVQQFLGLTLEDVFYTDASGLLFECGSTVIRSKRKIMKKTMTPEYKERAKKERRRTWLQMRIENSDHGRLELRKLNPKVYFWLYLYDREFLMAHMPEKLPSNAGTMRHDWEKRDQEILDQVTEVVQHLINIEGKPQRLTLKRIQEIIGKQCLMPKHLKKMPLTKEYLGKVLESSAKFRERRVEWAIKELKVQDEPLTMSRIKIKAGVSVVGDVSHLII